jgi:hypothetical protein
MQKISKKAFLLTAHQITLLNARRVYSKCAAKIENKIKTGNYTEELSSQIVGVGLAADWVRRAAEMDSIQFIGNHLNNSDRNQSFVELTRFGFSWYGINALFARDEVIKILGTLGVDSELERFRIIFNSAALPQSEIDTYQNRIWNLLKQKTTPRLPNSSVVSGVTVLQAINAKYVPSNIKTKGLPKRINLAAQTDNLTGLDLPSLIYAFRNWSVHGNALDGAFGGKPRFLAYISEINNALAKIHLGVALALENVL